MAATLATIFATAAGVFCVAQSQNGDFDFTNGPIPNPFQLHQHYPDRPETVECRPIRLHIGRGSLRFSRDLVTNDHPRLQFAHADARVMSLRLQQHLNELAEDFYELYSVSITVTKAWSEYEDADIADPGSLHYEGRTVRVSVDVHLVSPLLQLAVQVGFDWVFYADENYVRMSVIPNLCDISLDMVFLLDRSGSVGLDNFNKALYFLQNVVSFFNIASNQTQVGLVTYSTGATIEFDLNDFQTSESVVEALRDIVYTRGWTATALALGLTRFILDPEQSYGARPFSDGIPKVAVLITDGRSNQLPITNRANALRDFGVQVYTVGVGDIYLPELRFIASDPDQQHVFLLNSFNDAQGFVDLLSFTTCDTPAVVEPGEDTRTEIEEDEFRFFQSRCAAFSQTIMIEQIDLVGRCSLYASSVVPNPGPLDPDDRVVRNEDQTNSYRSVHLTLPDNQEPFVYVSVLGKRRRNEFSIVIWDMIFGQDEYTITILAGAVTVGQEIFNLVNEIGMTDARFTFAIRSGNEDGQFALDPETGILAVATPQPTEGSFRLDILAQNRQHACHRSKVVVTVVVRDEELVFDPLPQPVNVSETTAPGETVAQISVISSGTSALTYSIIAGNTGDDFDIDQTNGAISVGNPLDFEGVQEYNLTVEVRSTVSLATITAEQIIIILDVNEPPFFLTDCALADNCSFSFPEDEPANITVGIVRASDQDTLSPVNSMLIYSLEPADSIPFQISNDGEIRTTEPLDFESVMSYLFSVVVQDEGNPPSPRIQTSVNVSVIDVAVNREPFFAVDCTIEVLESLPVGNPFLQCLASDNDENGNPVFGLTYEIVGGNDDNTFRVEPSFGPGVIVTTRPLDREDIDLYTLTLNATDPERLMGSTTFQVIVVDVNDSPPTCSPQDDMVVVDSTSLPSSSQTLTLFTAVDPDLNSSAPIFSIETVFNTTTDTAEVTVRVTDGEDSSLFSTCRVTIQYEEQCINQEYAIAPATGALSARLLCSAAIEPAQLELEEGRSRRIICNAVTNVPLQYQFTHNGTSITGIGPSNELVLLRVDINDAGEYRCRAISDQLGSILSSPSIVTILLPPAITVPPSDVSAGEGEEVQFQCIATGIPVPAITWIRPNGDSLMETDDGRFSARNDTLTISDVQTGDSGVYTCVASNPADVAMAAANLTVFQIQQLVLAEVPEYFVPSQDMTCHEFDSSHFNSVLTGITSHETVTTAQVSKNLCPVSSCNPSPCENGGVCVTNSSSHGGYTCQCPPEYVGSNCEKVTDPCTRTPCLNDGLCASTSKGKFICSCSDGFHSDRCQYTDVCLSSAPCPPEEMCLETVVTSEGYVCVDVEGGEGEGVSVTVEDGGVGSSTISELDGEVNFYVEMTADMTGVTKRSAEEDEERRLEDNGFVTVCEGRFIPSPTRADAYILVWACPMGVAAPGGVDEMAICDLLIERHLVTSCTSREAGTVYPPPPLSLPPTAVNITFILIDPSTNQPMSAEDALIILQQTDARAKLNTTIYRTERFSAVVPPESNSAPSDTGRIVGAVIGTLVAVIVVAVVVVTVVCLTRQRRNKMKSVESNELRFPRQQNGNGTLSSVTFSNHYAPIPQHARSHEEKLLTTTLDQQSVFDDPVYESGFTASTTSSGTYTPPVTKKKSLSLERGMRSSLERGMKLIKEKVSSMPRSESQSGEVLLAPPTREDDSDDYDDIQASNTTPSEDDGEEIYANIDHTREGAMGNAGQRWQSYWKTRTLIRTSVSDSDPTKK